MGLMLAAAVMLAMAGCGGGHDDRPLIETVIPSDPDVDGDIVQSPAGVRTVTFVGPGITGVFAGVDPDFDDVYRAFLHFPLDSVPLNATIQSATLSIVIRRVFPATALAIPIRIELVSFAPPLESNDFLLPPLASTTIIPPISFNDVNREVNVDVTALMVQAQINGEPAFQVRIMQDNDILTAVPGRIEIDEATVANEPLLTVVYF